MKSMTSIALNGSGNSKGFKSLDELAAQHLSEQIEEEVEARVQEHLKARQQAEQANDTKGIFLANMSHEIRTPLNSILGYAQMLLREGALGTEHSEHLEKIILSSRHLLSLINDVLDLSKIEVGRMEVVNTVFDVEKLVHAIEVILGPKAAEKGLDLNVAQSARTPHYARGDEAKLRQIVVNLVANAIKFTDDGAVTVSIDLDVEEDRKILVVDVKDTGQGIEAEQIERLFEPFHQLPSSAAKEGTGLGLTISREYARLLGADLSVESEPGVGSVFTLRMPVEADYKEDAELPELEEKGKVIGLREPEPCKILIVDDNRDTIRFTTAFLESIGFSVSAAYDGMEALTRFDEDQPALVLMDRRMPRLDGLEALRRIKSTDGGRDVPIVMISASAFEEDYTECIHSGADGFIRKPYLEEELLREISRLTGVRYTYEAGKKVLKRQPLSAEQVSSLPEDCRARLVESILRGDQDGILRQLENLKGFEESVVQDIRKLAKSFQYEKLLTLLTPGTGSAQ